MVVTTDLNLRIKYSRVVELQSRSVSSAAMQSPAKIIPMPSPDDDSADKKSAWVQLANYSQLAFIFPAATIVGWLFGAGLDRWLHTNWLYLVGLILGIIAGFVELVRIAMADTK